jgi:hypothetical protein
MEYVMACYEAPTFHHDPLFIPLHYTYVPFSSSICICIVFIVCSVSFIVW